MNGRKALLTLIIVLFVSSCSSLEAYFENSSVVFVSPTEGLRLIEVPRTGQTLYTPLELILFSNHEEPKLARVWVNDVGPAYCLLTPAIKQDCGQIPLMNPGPQTVRVEIDIMDGNTVYATQTYTVSFLWAPYEGWDIPANKLAQVLHKETAATGYKLFAFILVAVLSLAGYFLFRRSFIVSLLCGWTGLVLLAVAYAFSGSPIAQSIAWLLVVLSALLAILGYAGYRYYQFRLLQQRTVTLPPDSWKDDPDERDVSENNDVIEAETTILSNDGYLPSPLPQDPEILS